MNHRLEKTWLRERLKAGQNNPGQAMKMGDKIASRSSGSDGLKPREETPS